MIQVTEGVITAAMAPHRAWKGRPWSEFVKEVKCLSIDKLTKDTK
jgi:hypothetical protein